jgi:hypothetical protein
MAFQGDISVWAKSKALVVDGQHLLLCYGQAISVALHFMCTTFEDDSFEQELYGRGIVGVTRHQ